MEIKRTAPFKSYTRQDKAKVCKRLAAYEAAAAEDAEAMAALLEATQTAGEVICLLTQMEQAETSRRAYELRKEALAAAETLPELIRGI